jgi:acylglycerol lipase
MLPPRPGCGLIDSMTIHSWTTAGVMLGAVACGAPYVPMRTAVVDTRAPPDIAYGHEKFVADDGLELYEQRWAPTGSTRGAVVLVHGLKDHSTRYSDLAVSLAQQGLAVEAFDVRGHGYSAGVRDHLESASQCVSDLDRVVNRVRLRAPDRPLFILGQGFGATIAALYTVRTKPKLAGLVLSAPSLRGKTMTATERFGDNIAGMFAPTTGRLPMDFAAYSTDKRAVTALRNDPLIAPGEITSGTARAMLKASDEVQRRIGEITVPLLIMDGAEDQISDHQAVLALAEAAKAPDKTVTVYPGLAYDLFHETARDQVAADTIDWLRKQATLAAPPPAATPAAAAAPAKLVKARARRKK